ncbi:kinase-like protein, partial [Hyphopichia burtonii NRRL Y-1933]
MSSDLVGLLENPNIHLSIPQIKCLMLQLLEGTNYIHQQRYLHRDIKAANILIDYNGILKIADFGLARHYHGKKPDLGKGPGGGERNYTALVVTRWYRPPELLLGERKYTTSVDMWGVGCVFGELFNHKPILAGLSDSQQAQIIFELIGPPTSDNWYNANLLPNKTDYTIGLRCKRTLETRFSRFMKQDGLNLLSGLLALDPFKRLNSLDAINHEYFKNEPLPLKPHELPRFEESHEIDKERYKKQKQNNETSGYNSGPSAPVPSINAKAQPKVDTYIPNRSNRTETYIPRPKNNYPRTETYIPQPKPKN